MAMYKVDGRMRKCFYPLESHPDVFNEVTHGLGVSPSLVWSDVLSIDEPEILAMTPRPALALVLVFPSTPTYQEQKREEDAAREAYTGCGADEPVVWWKQTIYNACGLYGILHAISNGPARQYIQPDTVIAGLLEKAVPLKPEERALVLEGSPELEKIHTAAAMKGDTAPPAYEAAETLCHYTCFVTSSKTGNLYLLDGDRKGPIDLGVKLPEGEDMLSAPALEAVRAYLQREDNLNFNLLALVKEEK
ncbi:ubiquitin carboxyl-terminal hydrolase [Phanerochaete sordida]|uniref:Ubiquitin carboxyl-terminal hydrolase n=1 Tax=Phanerochaete sordida TaxID=48140 RepID=A0A9P3L734_9APHY|nr:ubiquitin carboxyl-terminal hydrolase [Phanerochaete sordida]